MTGMEEPGVSFRGHSPIEMFQNVLFIGETALNEGIAAFYGLTVDDVKERLTEDGTKTRKELTAAKKRIKELEVIAGKWDEFKKVAADVGLVIDL